MKKPSLYTRFTKAASRFTGHPAVFSAAGALILVWLLLGPLFRFSEAWQMSINTVTTIITFLMVFLIQSTQNRDTEAMQIKLDELIRATQGAHTALLDLEELEESDIEEFRRRYTALAREARVRMESGDPDTGTPEA